MLSKTAGKQSKKLSIKHTSVDESNLIQHSCLAAVGVASETFSFNKVNYFKRYVILRYFIVLYSTKCWCSSSQTQSDCFSSKC